VENPLQKLFEQLNSGALGDESLPFSLLIAAFRRQRLLAGATGPRGDEDQLYVGVLGLACVTRGGGGGCYR
jgi:hypothetical protein